MSLQGVLVLVVLLALAGSALADVRMVDPLVISAKPGKIIDAGSLMPGETGEFIFDPDSGYGQGAKWTQAILGEEGEGSFIQGESSAVGTKSLITRVRTNSLTPLGVYDIPLTLKGTQGILVDESYTLRITLEKNLERAALSAKTVEGNTNTSIAFHVAIVNDSSALMKALVQPGLPSSWAMEQRVQVRPHSFEDVTLNITPRFAGTKNFDIIIVNENTGEKVDTLKGTLIARPTLKDQYASAWYGFPFFTISLVANYLTNAFASLLL